MSELESASGSSSPRGRRAAAPPYGETSLPRTARRARDTGHSGVLWEDAVESVARAAAEQTPESPAVSLPIDLRRTILSVFPEPPRPGGFYARHGKPVFDRVAAFLLLLLAAPVMAIVAVAIRLDSPGAVLLRQKRVGLGGVVFQMLKFRSMVDGAEKDSGPVWAQPGDPRTTRIGRVLRLYRLDELPQLLNVLRGEMSLVGPRPERPVFVRRLSGDIPGYDWRHIVKPGVTGFAQVSYQYTASRDQSAVKLLYDLEYIRSLSFGRDLRILWNTMPVVLRRSGAA